MTLLGLNSLPVWASETDPRTFRLGPRLMIFAQVKSVKSETETQSNARQIVLFFKESNNEIHRKILETSELASSILTLEVVA